MGAHLPRLESVIFLDFIGARNASQLVEKLHHIHPSKWVIELIEISASRGATYLVSDGVNRELKRGGPCRGPAADEVLPREVGVTQLDPLI